MTDLLAQQDSTTKQWLCVNCGQLIEHCSCDVDSEDQHDIEVARSKLITGMRAYLALDHAVYRQSEIDMLIDIREKVQTLLERLQPVKKGDCDHTCAGHLFRKRVLGTGDVCLFIARDLKTMTETAVMCLQEEASDRLKELEKFELEDLERLIVAGKTLDEAVRALRG